MLRKQQQTDDANEFCLEGVRPALQQNGKTLPNNQSLQLALFVQTSDPEENDNRVGV